MLSPILLVAAVVLGNSAPPLRVATFNLQVLSARDSDARFDAVAQSVAAAQFPPVVALQEVADNDGSANTGETSAAQTYQRLLGALARAGGPNYNVIEVTPADGSEGGLPGANIRNAFLTTLPAQASTMALARNAPAFANTRQPLVVELLWQTTRLVLINVHLSAAAGGLHKRSAQAQMIARFARGLQAQAGVIVLGDFNATDDESVYSEFVRAGLVDALAWSPQPTHQSGARFDRIFTSSKLNSMAGGVLPLSSASDHALVWADLAPLVAADALGESGGCNTAPGKAKTTLPIAWVLVILTLSILARCRATPGCGRMLTSKRTSLLARNTLGLGSKAPSRKLRAHECIARCGFYPCKQLANQRVRWRQQ